MARLGWRPHKLRHTTDQWITYVIMTTFRNRPPGIYKPGAEKRVIESAIDWYWLGRFPSNDKFIEFLEAEIEGEEI